MKSKVFYGFATRFMLKYNMNRVFLIPRKTDLLRERFFGEYICVDDEVDLILQDVRKK